jgi:hypothetical protein
MAKNEDMIKEMSNFLPFWHFKENVKKTLIKIIPCLFAILFFKI